MCLLNLFFVIVLLILYLLKENEFIRLSCNEKVIKRCTMEIWVLYFLLDGVFFFFRWIEILKILKLI